MRPGLRDPLGERVVLHIEPPDVLLVLDGHAQKVEEHVAARGLHPPRDDVQLLEVLLVVAHKRPLAPVRYRLLVDLPRPHWVNVIVVGESRKGPPDRPRFLESPDLLPLNVVHHHVIVRQRAGRIFDEVVEGDVRVELSAVAEEGQVRQEQALEARRRPWTHVSGRHSLVELEPLHRPLVILDLLVPGLELEAVERLLVGVD
mmetsp:Transcript_9504/g.21573  ORF Transcript_9504/g.21573 Transcript_9504/m.21573 type:complete len:202 (-) Transcript_9504:2923-3528(-)